MRKLSFVGIVMLIVFSFGLVPSSAVSTTDTRLLSQPAISRSHIAFVYAGDLWVAGLDGKNVRRLTTGAGRVATRRSRPTAR